MAVEGLVRVSAARREQAVRDYKAAPKVLISEELVGMAYRRNFQIDVLAATGVSVPLEDIYGGDVVLTPEQCARLVNHLGGHFEVGSRIGVAFAVVDEVVYVAESFLLLTDEQASRYSVEVLSPVLWERGLIGIGTTAVKLVAVSKTSNPHLYESHHQRSAKAGCRR